MKMTDYEWLDRGRRREKVLVEVMSKPRMPFEVHDILQGNGSSKLSVTFKELRERGLVEQKAKGLYGLTERGQRLRKKLLREKGVPYRYVELRVDWKTYAWVLVGIQRRVLIKVMERCPQIAAELLRLARKIHGRLSRTDAYRVLTEFALRRLAEAERDERNVRYVLTRRGDMIKKQLIAAWLAFFIFI